MSVGIPKAAAPSRTRPRSAVRTLVRPQPHPAREQSPSVGRWIVERLGPHEIRRRLLHMAPGFLPLFVVPVPHQDPLSWYSRGAILAATLAITSFALWKGCWFKRHEECGWLTSVLSYAATTLVMLLGFPAQPELGLIVTTIIAFGDGSATLIGLLARGPKLPWNVCKSWAGFTSFIVCSVPIGVAVYLGEARPNVTIFQALACVTPAVVAAAFAESLPMRLNDNVRVGTTAAVTIVLTHAIFVGW